MHMESFVRYRDASFQLQRFFHSILLDECYVHNHSTLLCYHLVERSSTSENNVRIVHLNSSLSKPHQISPNPYGSASYLQNQTILSKHLTLCFSDMTCLQLQLLQSYQVHGDDLLISQRRLSSNHSGPFQIFHTQPFILSNDVSDLVPAWQHI